jgi:hypothetical protein
VSSDNVYVQSQLVFTLRIFRGVSTGRATLSSPEIGGGEAIVEMLGEDQEYQIVRDGRNFIVRERRFAVFPQQAGVFSIAPMNFEAVVVASSGFSSVQRFGSEPVQFTALPAVAPPPQMAGAAWLPATRLRLSEDWSEDPAEVTVGEPLTRTIVIEADGVLETQLPELALSIGEGLRQYADQPELTREVTDGGRFRARRVERLAVIAQASGELRLPAVELPWWNVELRRWELARLEPRTVAATAPALAATAATLAIASRDADGAGADPGPWRAIALGLAAAWLLSLFGWWLSARRAVGRVARTVEPAIPRRPQYRRLLRQIAELPEPGAAERARALVLEWGRLRFPADPPLSLGALAARLPPGAAEEIRALEASLYGPLAGAWRGQGLAAALRGLDAVERPREGSRDELLPLYR